MVYRLRFFFGLVVQGALMIDPKITKAFVELLQNANVSFAVLGPEESCTGDPAKRAGNEFLFQMQASTNIEVPMGIK